MLRLVSRPDPRIDGPCRSVAQTSGIAGVLAVLVTLGMLVTAGCGGHAQHGAGNAARGRVIFAQKCASCHGAGGTGGIASRLKGSAISIDDVRSRIDNGTSGMPVGLVTGKSEDDVVAYVARLLSRSGTTRTS